MSVEHLWNDNVKGKSKKSERKPSLHYFVHYRSNMDWPCIMVSGQGLTAWVLVAVLHTGLHFRSVLSFQKAKFSKTGVFLQTEIYFWLRRSILEIRVRSPELFSLLPVQSLIQQALQVVCLVYERKVKWNINYEVYWISEHRTRYLYNPK